MTTMHEAVHPIPVPSFPPNPGSSSRRQAFPSRLWQALCSGTAVGVLWLPAALTLVVLRGVLFHKGWIEYSADFTVNIHHAAEWQNWATAWNSALGMDNSATLSEAPPNLLFFSLFSTAVGQKVMLGLAYFTMGSTMFSTMRWWLRRLRGTEVPIVWPLLASAVFTINGWVAVETLHWYYLWMYALLPLTFRLAIKSLEADEWLTCALWSMLAGTIAIATFTAFGIAFHSILVGILVVVWLLSPPHRWAQRLRRAIWVLATFVAGVCASGMYWLLPTLFGFHSNYANGTSWAIFNTQSMFILSPYTPIYDTIRGMYDQVSGVLATLAVGHIGWIIGAGLMFMLVALAMTGLFLDGRDWTITGVATAGLVFLFIANGTNVPLGSTYARIASAPGLRQLAYVLFKGPYKLVPETIFCLFLLGFAALAGRHQTSSGSVRVLKGVSVVALVAGCFLVGSPLLTGNLDGYITPVQPPKQYVAALDQLGQIQSRQPGSTVWLPLDSSGDGAPPDWGPRRAQLPLIGGQLPPETAWLAPPPVSSRSVTWAGPASGRLYDELLSDALENVPESNLGELLTAGGRRYVAVRLDAGAAVAADAKLLSTTLGLTRIDANPWLDAYKASSNTVATPQSVDVGVGGLDQLVIASGRGSSSPSSRPIVFATDLPSSTRTRQEVLDQASEVSFSPGQGWNDLALDAWSGPGTVLDLANSVSETVPLTAWQKSALDSNDWLPMQLAGLEGQLFSPSIAPTFLSANGPASTTEKVCSSSTGDEVWIRHFVSPLGGGVRVSVDGNSAGSLSNTATSVGGWVWGKLATLQPSSGCHTIGIHVDGGLSGLDQMAVVPTGAVAKAVTLEQTLLAASDVSSGGYWDELSPLAVIRSFAQLPTTLSATSGSLDSGLDRSNRALPVTIDGNAHPVSHFFSAKLTFLPSNFSGGELLDLNVDTHTTYPLTDLTVFLTDTHGTTSSYQPIVSAGSQVLSLMLGTPITTRGKAGEIAPPIDLGAIDQIDFQTRPNIPTSTALQFTLSSIDLMGEAPIKTISVPRSGTYRLVIGRASPRSETASVQGVDVRLTPSNGWETSPPLRLQAGNVTISTSQPLGNRDIVELFSGVGEDTWWSVSAHRFETHSSGRTLGPARTIFLTTTPFSPQWAMAGTPSSAHLQMNGFVNGYLSSSARVGAETFGPNYWLVVGRYASAVFLAGLMALLGLIYLRRRTHSEDLK